MTTTTIATSFNVTATFSRRRLNTFNIERRGCPRLPLAGTKASQLYHALLEQCYGEGFQSFNNSADCIKENLLVAGGEYGEGDLRTLVNFAAMVHHD